MRFGVLSFLRLSLVASAFLAISSTDAREKTSANSRVYFPLFYPFIVACSRKHSAFACSLFFLGSWVLTLFLSYRCEGFLAVFF